MVEKLLSQYKELTIHIIEKLRADKDIDTLMEERESLLKDIDALKLNQEEMLKEYNRLDIKSEDESLGRLITNKMTEVKDGIRDSKVRRTAYSSYASTNRQGNLFVRKV